MFSSYTAFKTLPKSALISRISRSLSKSLQQSTNNTATSDNIYSFQDSIQNLGIILLELCFGIAIEDHRLGRTMGASEEQTLQLINYAVAIQWAREVVEEAGPEHSDAVTWCLHYTPESSDAEGKKMKSGGRNPDLSAGAKIESCNQPKTTLLVFSSPSCSLNWQRCPARPC